MSNDLAISEREREILRLVATGATNQQIALQLHISPNTVKVHLRNIFSKIGVVSRTEATVYAIRHGLVAISAEQGAEPTKVSIAEEVSAQAGPAPAVPEAAPPAWLASEPAPIPTTSEAVAVPSHSIESTAIPASTRSYTRLLWIVGSITSTLIVAIILGAFLFFPPLPPAQATATPPTPENASQRWFTHSPLPSPRNDVALVAYDLDQKLYVIGGQIDNTSSAALDRYDPVSDRWISLPNKPTALGHASAIILRGNIYVPGGENAQGKVSDLLEIYDPREQRWIQGISMPSPRSRYALVAWEGLLYVIGGWDGVQACNDVYIYNPEEHIWSEGPALLAPRQNAGAVTASGRIYVIGGSNDSGPLRESLQLDPAEAPARWKAIAPLPEAIAAPGVAAPISTLFAFDPTQHRGFQYDVSVDAWMEFTVPTNVPISSQATLLGSSIYFIGETKEYGPGIISEYKAFFTVFLPSP
ncbi:MAG: LuxR family transcriptional regulator [Oscillochloris sp.]|nr:LuxR family transcriptional regulator [Oscillochloris sp.]